jgi:hypothetical protein
LTPSKTCVNSQNHCHHTFIFEIIKLSYQNFKEVCSTTHHRSFYTYNILQHHFLQKPIKQVHSFKLTYFKLIITYFFSSKSNEKKGKENNKWNKRTRKKKTQFLETKRRKNQNIKMLISSHFICIS